MLANAMGDDMFEKAREVFFGTGAERCPHQSTHRTARRDPGRRHRPWKLTSSVPSAWAATKFTEVKWLLQFRRRRLTGTRHARTLPSMRSAVKRA
jgi:hypothetical protein